MPDVEEKTVDIDTTGPGAEVDISEEIKAYFDENGYDFSEGEDEDEDDWDDEDW